MVGNNDTANPTIQTIPNLPQFHPDEQWLMLAKKLLQNAGELSNTAKFLALYKSLPRDIQNDCKEMLQSDENNTYDMLCEELNRRFETPAHVKFKNMYIIETIGDRSPTQFLKDLRRKHASFGVTDVEHLQFAFAQGLPEQYKPLVFSDIPANLDGIAERIEKLHNINESPVHASNSYPFQVNNHSSMPNCAIANINSKEKNDQNMKDKAMLNEMRQMQLLEDLKETMNKLNKRIDEVESSISSANKQSQTQDEQYYRPYHQRVMNQQKKPNYNYNSSRPKFNPNGYCEYHRVFGHRARNCMQPCNWRRENTPRKSFNQGNY